MYLRFPHHLHTGIMIDGNISLSCLEMSKRKSELVQSRNCTCDASILACCLVVSYECQCKMFGIFHTIFVYYICCILNCTGMHREKKASKTVYSIWENKKMFKKTGISRKPENGVSSVGVIKYTPFDSVYLWNDCSTFGVVYECQKNRKNLFCLVLNHDLFD